MVRKSLNARNGVKANRVLYERKHSPYKHHEKDESQEQIKYCINCKKPARECKGDCFEKQKKAVKENA